MEAGGLHSRVEIIVAFAQQQSGRAQSKIGRKRLIAALEAALTIFPEYPLRHRINRKAEQALQAAQFALGILADSNIIYRADSTSR